MTIKTISATDTFAVRHPVLRAGKPVSSCLFEGDQLPTTQHLGVYELEQLIGVVSLFLQNNSVFSVPRQMQLRGMAVLTQYQKKGYGATLVQAAEEQAVQSNIQLIWFNARIKAVPFYSQLGYQTIGSSFDIGDIGAHFLMFKIIVKK